MLSPLSSTTRVHSVEKLPVLVPRLVSSAISPHDVRDVRLDRKRRYTTRCTAIYEGHLPALPICEKVSEKKKESGMQKAQATGLGSVVEIQKREDPSINGGGSPASPSLPVTHPRSLDVSLAVIRTGYRGQQAGALSRPIYLEARAKECETSRGSRAHGEGGIPKRRLSTWGMIATHQVRVAPRLALRRSRSMQSYSRQPPARPELAVQINDSETYSIVVNALFDDARDKLLSLADLWEE